MTAQGHIRGHPVTYTDGAWRYADGASADPNTPCVLCERPPTGEGHDACLGELPGVASACCGHGVPGLAYVTRSGGPRRILGDTDAGAGDAG